MVGGIGGAAVPGWAGRLHIRPSTRTGDDLESAHVQTCIQLLLGGRDLRSNTAAKSHFNN